MSELSVVPCRSFSDFIGEESRFQVPNVQDLEKWSNRVLHNLLYYQTNYCILFAVVFLLVGMVNPTQLTVGMISTLATLALLNYLANNQEALAVLKRRHPYVCLSIMLLGGYFIMSMIGSVLIFSFGIALPIILIYAHASLRLRNLKSKIFNSAESIGLIKTPMGLFLEQLGETFDQLASQERQTQ